MQHGLIKGQEYRRREIHGLYGGQEQGGISTPAQHPVILLFTSERGKEHGYHDHWVDGVFYYSGEGPTGDMRFDKGNKAIRNHLKTGKDLLLFKQTKRAHVAFVGEMICTGYHHEQGEGNDGIPREMIVFELVPADAPTAEAAPQPDESPAESLLTKSLAELRQLAQAAAQPNATPKQRLTWHRDRSRAVKAYVLHRANGVCEGCAQPAPFKTSKGTPYLEPHHTRRLSDDGPDDPRWVVAVCPNCHRRAHYGEDGEAYNQQLTQVAHQREKDQQ